MDNKIPEWFLSFQENLLSAQLRAIRQRKTQPKKKPKTRPGEGMSKMDMAIDILRQAHRPLHVSEILAQIKTRHGATVDRESLVSALVKKVHRHQGVIRTAPNTFEVK